MKKDKTMSSHGSLTTIIYGGSFEERKASLETWSAGTYKDRDFEKIYIDLAEDQYKIKDFRKTISEINYSSLRNSARIFIFLNSHKLSFIMQNMLLKTLEEPLKNTRFVLEISNYQSFIPTILSRSVLLKVGNQYNISSSVSDYPASDLLIKSSIFDLFKICEKHAQSRDEASNFISHLMSQVKEVLINKVELTSDKPQKLIAFLDFLLQSHEWNQTTNVSSKTILENAILGYRNCLT